MFEGSPQMIWILVTVLLLCMVILMMVVRYGKRGKWWLTLANLSAFTLGAMAAVGLYYLLGWVY